MLPLFCLAQALKQCLKLAQEVPSDQQRGFVTFVPSKVKENIF